jgi:hypothetical protein
METVLYRTALEFREWPPKAGEFMCASLIAEANEDEALSAWLALKAAWVCDDSKQFQHSAVGCRRRAAHLFARARESGQDVVQQLGGTEALLSDIYRRCCEFDRAAEWVEEGLKAMPDALVARVLAFQQQLISDRDSAVHRLDEGAG